MKMRTALAALAIVNIISLALVSGVGWWTFQRVDRARALQVEALRVETSVWRLRTTTGNLLTSDSLDQARTQWVAARESYVSTHDRFVELAEGSAFFSGEAAEAVGTLGRYVQQVQEQLARIDEALAAVDAVDPKLGSGGILRQVFTGDAAMEMFNLRRHVGTFTDFLTDTESQLVERFRRELDAGIEQYTQRQLAVILGSALALIAVSTVMVLVFAKSLYRKVRRLRFSLSRMAEGYLELDLNTAGRDEIAEIAGYVQRSVGEFATLVRSVQDSVRHSEELKETLSSTSEQSSSSVHQMTANIDSIGRQIKALHQKLSETGTSVSEIFSGVTELTRQIEDQSSAVTASSGAVEQMAASINNVAEITSRRTEASTRLVDVTKDGNEKVTATNQVVQEIAGSVEDIRQIIGIIDNVAEQTSILSMNASIEAAHAGEYGRGFSVVAEEIRSLSESTTENAKQIREQLEAISNGAGRAQTLSEQSSNSFSQVQEEVDRFTESLKEISSTTDELSSGSQETLKATKNLAESTQRIREAEENIETRTRSIDEAMKDIRDYSQQVEQAITEISSGTREITDGMGSLNEITRQTSEQIDTLSRSISRFGVR